MARISDRLVIQLVDSGLVFMDDSTGSEVLVDKPDHQGVVDRLTAADADVTLASLSCSVTVRLAEIPNALRAIEYLRRYA